MRLRYSLVLGVTLGLGCLLSGGQVRAQSFGVELFNTLTPASGGMAGTSIAAPQDNISAINGNAAALTQYHGTQFTVGGTWAGSTIDLNQTGNIPAGSPNPLITPFSAKSSRPGWPCPISAYRKTLHAPGPAGDAGPGCRGHGRRRNELSHSTG